MVCIGNEIRARVRCKFFFSRSLKTEIKIQLMGMLTLNLFFEMYFSKLMHIQNYRYVI